jgi:small-conductance mechanosensitive channel
MAGLEAFLELPIFRNSLVQWSIAVTVAAGLFLLLLAARRLVRRYHLKLKQTEEIELVEVPVEVLSGTSAAFFVVVSLFAGLGTLAMSDTTARVLASAATIALFAQAGSWAAAATGILLERRRRRVMETDRAVASSLGIIGFLLRAVIWSVIVLLMLDNLGIDVTALVAGLGIGGVAIALASQNILGDLFASLSITFDRPFVVGDFLIVDDYMGSVEFIGVKSTRLRSLSGEQIIMSNADLLKSRVRNYGRMAERRVVFTLNVAYDTSPELLERIPGLIREAVIAQPGTRFDRSHFSQHGASSLDFESVYYVLSADYGKYMDTRQALNLRIHREFTELGIEFAYPTQTLYLARAPAKSTPTQGEPAQ